MFDFIRETAGVCKVAEILREGEREGGGVFAGIRFNTQNQKKKNGPQEWGCCLHRKAKC